MRIKSLVEKVLRPFPPVYRVGSRVYHALFGSFRSISAEAPQAIQRALEEARRIGGEDPGDYYEFGIFRGFTFYTAWEKTEELGLKDMKLYGFDSFEGLPEVEGIDQGNGQFFQGQFAASKESVEANLRERGVDFSRVVMVKGFYNESLTEELRAQHPFRKAAVAMMDCDLYASTLDALKWMTPYLQDGSVIVFDDWHSYGGDPKLGQPRAWAEWLETRPGFRGEPLFEYKHHGKVFVLRGP